MRWRPLTRITFVHPVSNNRLLRQRTKWFCLGCGEVHTLEYIDKWPMGAKMPPPPVAYPVTLECNRFGTYSPSKSAKVHVAVVEYVALWERLMLICGSATSA